MPTGAPRRAPATSVATTKGIPLASSDAPEGIASVAAVTDGLSGTDANHDAIARPSPGSASHLGVLPGAGPDGRAEKSFPAPSSANFGKPSGFVRRPYPFPVAVRSR